MARPGRARWSLRPIEATLEGASGTHVRFLVEAANWGSAAARAHLVTHCEWPARAQPDPPELEPGHLHLAAICVEVPGDAVVGERMAIHVVLHGGGRPVECDLEVVVVGGRLVHPIAARPDSPRRL